MLNDLLERYWDAAYAEGKEGRDHDTEDGVAQRTAADIHAEVQRLVEAERERIARVLDAQATALRRSVSVAYSDDATETIKQSRAYAAEYLAQTLRSTV